MTRSTPNPPERLPFEPEHRIDRSRRTGFSFEGREYEGFAGDTIASALAGNGVRVLSRSFKYRRPRGILTLDGHDANALVQLPDEPNVPADLTPITSGLTVSGQNYSGSLAHDRTAVIGRFSRFLPVGFYYKAFFRPGRAWRFWEPVFRARAGLGRVNPAAASGRYETVHGFCDVAVIGAGPSGLAAAIEAARAGAHVLLVEEQPETGGALTYARLSPDSGEARRTLRTLREELAAQSNFDVMTGATCQGLYADNWLAVGTASGLHKIRARKVVLATGAMEQPVVFRNNDLPGIMLGSAAQRLVRHYGVRPGQRAVVVTASSEGYGVALDLHEAGIVVSVVLDLREAPPVTALAGAVRDQGIEILDGHTVYEALPSAGNLHLQGLAIRKIAGPGVCSGETRFEDCDLLCMGSGYVPSAQLACHRGGRLQLDHASGSLALRDCPPDMFLAGAVHGSHGLARTIAEGRRAGWLAARSLGLSHLPAPAEVAEEDTEPRTHPWPVYPHPKGKEFVDFDEDLQIGDIRDAIEEGYDDTELLKRYSTVGMGPSQGRHSALTTARLLADATGRDPADIGTTTVRPPVSAEKMGMLAGRHHDPVRLTPMHDRHVAAGAQMMAAGAWMRPAYYGRPDERNARITAEALNVRNNVGVIDVSTLGGLEIRGPGAGAFLERMYTSAYRRQPVGRLRYALMCDQAGAIIDDGVACRLQDQHYYVTTTTGGADRVYRDMLRQNAEWRLDVDITNATSAWSGINIAGPHSRELLFRITEDIDLAAGSFPYLGVRCGHVAQIPARVLRVGFVGELGYEIHVPASLGEALWDAVAAAGADMGLMPLGVEAQRLLRLEKGHIIVGQDTDGLSTPDEVGMGWAVTRRKPWFMGHRALDILSGQPATRRLAGFVLTEEDLPIPEECCLVISASGDIVGRVTSIMTSPTLNRTIGMAFLPPEGTEPGHRFHIRAADGRMVAAQVVQLPFYDPQNARQDT